MVPASALRTLRREFAFVVMFLTCGEKVKCVSKVMPRIFGSLSRGTGALLIVMCGCVLDWLYCGVKSVTDDLCGAMERFMGVDQHSMEERWLLRMSTDSR